MSSLFKCKQCEETKQYLLETLVEEENKFSIYKNFVLSNRCQIDLAVEAVFNAKKKLLQEIIERIK